MKKDMTIRITHLENKSRNGYYVYVKQEGHNSRYYKYAPGSRIDSYVEYYKDRYQKNRSLKGSLKDYVSSYTPKRLPIKGRLTLNKQSIAYLRKISKIQPIPTNFMQGISSSTINDIYQATNMDITKATKELLSPLVLNPKLLEILASPENINKIKTRLEFRYSIQGNEGEDLGSFSHIGKKSIYNSIQEVKSIIRKGIRIEPDSPKISEELKRMNYTFLPSRNEGFANKIKLTIIFRKE